jgi:Tfp pilus assembly protein PilZ
MYLSQTTLEVDTNKVYDYKGQEVYLTIPVTGSNGKANVQMMTKTGYETQGRGVTIYWVQSAHRKHLKLKETV